MDECGHVPSSVEQRDVGQEGMSSKETRRKLVFARLDAEERYHEACIACAKAERASLRAEMRDAAAWEAYRKAQWAVSKADENDDFGSEKRISVAKAYVLATHAQEKASAAQTRAWNRYMQASKAREASFALMQAASNALTEDMRKASEAAE